MNQGPRKIVLLGPQRPVANLGEAFTAAGFPEGPVAVISAGWQEAEGDIQDVHQLVNRPLLDLGLYERADEIFTTLPAFKAAYRERQEQLKELQQLYSARLRQLMIASRQLARTEGTKNMIAGELRHAISQLRALDRHHLQRVRSIHYAFDDDIRTLSGGELDAHVQAIKYTLSKCETILITGGNILILLNRMRLFGVDQMLHTRHLVAWSAGAMALSNQVVLYHDKTPLTRRDPEVLGEGAGVLPGYVFLPDAKRRLRSGEHVRTSLMSRRFHPRNCVTLDNGSMLQFEGKDLRLSKQARQLDRNGRFSRIPVA